MEENTGKKVDESWKEKSKTEANADVNREQEKPEAKLPVADFKFFLTTLGMQAWMALGIIQNPVTEKIEENIDQAKFFIDTLEILEKKTKGNLDKEESEFMEHLLYNLRLAFVDKTTKGKP